MTYKVYQAATVLSGENPDGRFDTFTLDLGSTDANSPVVRWERLIGYQRGQAEQSNPLARHWHTTRESLSGLLTSLGTNTITQQSLDRIPEEQRRNAAILVDSTAILMRTMALETVCSSTPTPALPMGQTRAQLTPQLSSVFNGPNLYLLMGGEDDDAGLPDPTIATPLSFSDDDLRLIDQFLGYNPEAEPPADNLIHRDWHNVRRNIVSARHEGTNTIAQTDLPPDDQQARIAAVVLNSWGGILRILRSPNFMAGRGYRDPGSIALTAVQANPGANVTIAQANVPANAQVFLDNGTTALTGVTINAQGITIPYASIPAGAHTLTVKRADGSTYGTASITTTAPAVVENVDGGRGDGGTPVVVERVDGGGGDGGSDAGPNGAGGTSGVPSGGGSNYSTGQVIGGLIVGALSLIGLGTVARATWNYFRSPSPAPVNPPRGNPPPVVDPARGNPPPAVDPAAAAEPAKGATPPPADPPPADPAPKAAVAPAAADPAPRSGVLAAIAAMPENLSPVAGNEITPDNVVITGADARPTAELNRGVVMSQVAMLYPEVFLTEAARTLLRDGRPLSELPAGDSPFISNQVNSLQGLAEYAMSQSQSIPDGQPTLAERWNIELGQRSSIIRGGLPEALLREVIHARLEQWRGAGAPGFDRINPDSLRIEAERLAGERSRYEGGIREFLRRGRP